MTLFAADVARPIEARLAHSCADVAQEVLWLAGGVLCFSAGTDWLCRAFGIGMGEPVTSEEIERIVDFYEQRGVPASVELCPYAHPSFAAGLSRRGFRIEVFEQVFFRDLADPIVHDGPPGVQVRRVDPADDALVELFCDVSTSGFRDGKPLDAETLRVIGSVVRHPRCDSYLAWAGGKAVGGGTVEVLGEVGALFGTSVLASHRRRGVQAALIAARLRRAQEGGARIASIDSRPGVATERNAARMGFQVGYTKVLLGLSG